MLNGLEQTDMSGQAYDGTTNNELYVLWYGHYYYYYIQCYMVLLYFGTHSMSNHCYRNVISVFYM